MFRKLSGAELREWVEKQMEKENRSLENNFFSRIVGKQDDITDEELDRLYEDAVKRLEMQEELQKKEEKKEHLRKEKWKKRFSFKGDSDVGYRKLSKVAGFVIVCAIAVFAASMTIEANRNYFVDSVKYLTGNDTKILIDNDASNDKPSLDEEQARDKIEEEMGVEVPEFLYRPETFEFHDCFISNETRTAKIQYLYKRNFISLYVGKKDIKSSSNSFSLLGRDSETIYIPKEDIAVSVVKIQEETDLEPSYLAEWEWKSCYYQLSGKMPKKIFEKILKEMIF